MAARYRRASVKWLEHLLARGKWHEVAFQWEECAGSSGYSRARSCCFPVLRRDVVGVPGGGCGELGQGLDG
jgi:hypothetical protein